LPARPRGREQNCRGCHLDSRLQPPRRDAKVYGARKRVPWRAPSASAESVRTWAGTARVARGKRLARESSPKGAGRPGQCYRRAIGGDPRPLPEKEESQAHTSRLEGAPETKTT